MRFENKTYCATKNNGSVQPTLILSIPSSSNITLVVYETTHGENIYTYSYIRRYNIQVYINAPNSLMNILIITQEPRFSV